MELEGADDEDAEIEDTEEKNEASAE